MGEFLSLSVRSRIGLNRAVVGPSENRLWMYAMPRLLSLTILTILIATPTLAQQAPPGRVGRVSFVSGNLAFHTAGQTEWSAAAVNYPVATGASLWTDAEARAEIRIAPDTIDIASGTELDVVELDERVTRFSVPQGRIILHLRGLDKGQSAEIDIPRGAIQLQQPGYYDLDAGAQDQPARVAVFDGSARFVGNGADIVVKAGDVAMLNGTSSVAATIEPAVADAFVEWCRSRDYDEKRLAAPYHVSPRMTGSVELDEHGRWDTAPAYGEVWYPNVPAGWVPYTNGRWVWVAPWGWTWVDAEPWGFAPCHYGRWAMVGDSWGWAPGAFEASPVYAPGTPRRRPEPSPSSLQPWPSVRNGRAQSPRARHPPRSSPMARPRPTGRWYMVPTPPGRSDTTPRRNRVRCPNDRIHQARHSPSYWARRGRVRRGASRHSRATGTVRQRHRQPPAPGSRRPG